MSSSDNTQNLIFSYCKKIKSFNIFSKYIFKYMNDLKEVPFPQNNKTEESSSYVRKGMPLVIYIFHKYLLNKVLLPK